MELIIHSQTSILQPLKSGNGIRSFIPDFVGQVIIHPCWDIGIMFVIKWAPEDHRRWLETVARLWDSVCMLTSSCKEGLLAFKWRSSFKLKTEKSREITFVVVVCRRHLRFSLVRYYCFNIWNVFMVFGARINPLPHLRWKFVCQDDVKVS